MRKSLSLMLSLVVMFGTLSLTGCALFKPTPDGKCPQFTVLGTEGIAYACGRGALLAGAPASILTEVAANIDAAVATGKLDSSTITVALVAKAGGWMKELAGVAAIFADSFQAALDDKANAQVCTLPVAQSISKGLKLAAASADQPASARLAHYK